MTAFQLWKKQKINEPKFLMMKQILKLMRVFTIASVLFSCSKKNSDDPTPPVDNNTFKQEPITKINFQFLSSGYPTDVYFQYRTTTRSYFGKKDSDIYRIEFHGLNGRTIVEGNPKHMGHSSNLTQWPIRIGDTIRIFKNGAKYRDYVTEIEDNINDGINYPISFFNVTITQQVADQARTDLNRFTGAGGLMSTMKFEKR